MAIQCVPASASDFYVDAKNGLDSNSGTSPAQAWKTLNPVNNRVLAPGDTVNLKSGTNYTAPDFNNVLFLTREDSGTKQQPVVIRSYGKGARPRLFQTFRSNRNSAVLGFIGPVSNVIIDGLHLQGLKGEYDKVYGKDGLDVFSTALVMNWEASGWKGYSSNVTIQNCEIEGGCRGLLLYNCVNYDIKNNYIHDVNGANKSTRDWAPLWPEQHVGTRPGNTGYPLDKIRFPSGSDDDSGAEAIDISVYGRNIRIASNRVENVYYNSHDYTVDGTFIEVYGSDVRGVEVCYNTVKNVPGGTVEMGYSEGGVVENFDFHHNLVIDASNFYAIHAGGTFGLDEIKGIQFNNNTFIQREIPDDNRRPFAIFDVNGTIKQPEDVKVQNNIFYLRTGTKMLWNGMEAPSISAVMGDDDVFVHKNNLFYHAPGAKGRYKFNVPLDPSEKTTLDPRLADIRKGNFVPAPGSPAVDGGIALGYTRDLLGNPIAADKTPNIGALERTKPGTQRVNMAMPAWPEERTDGTRHNATVEEALPSPSPRQMSWNAMLAAILAFGAGILIALRFHARQVQH